MKYNSTITFNNVYLKDSYTICSKLENAGPLNCYIKEKSKNNYFECKSFEKAEVKFLKRAIDYLLNLHEVDLIVSGDLNESNMASNYANANNNTPFIGIYGACSNIIESIIVASNFIESKNFNHVICATSSHNGNAEKLFRYPVEYGLPKAKTQTYTSTGASSCLLTSEIGNIKIKSATIGKIIDIGLKNPNDFGSVMAPSAIDVFVNHCKDLDLDENYYDLVLTGDLSTIGKEIFSTGVRNFGFNLKNYEDCGLLLYDVKKQKVNMGGSGCATIGLVFLSYIKELLEEKKYRKVLIIGTGALINKTLTLQKVSIPAISYAIGVEIV